VLVFPDVRAALVWLTEVFDFRERLRIGEAHRCQLQADADGAVIVADVRHDQVAPDPGVVSHLIKVRVEDVDAQVEGARARGARILQDPHEYEDGEKEVAVVDPAGHLWQFTQTMRDGAPGVGRLIALTQMPKPAGPRGAAGVCAGPWGRGGGGGI
jgi:uncharacterized glyoxalase superfamily protein PhnB